MRVVLLAVLCCVGCDAVFGLGEPGDADGGDAGTSGDGGAGDDAGGGAGALIVDPTGDADLDGLPNGTDPCPHVPAVASSADSDQDGVGDICDPDPQVAGDCLLLFDDLRSDPASVLLPWLTPAGAFVAGKGLVVPSAIETVIALDRSLALTSLTVEATIDGGADITLQSALQMFPDHADPFAATGCGLRQEVTSEGASSSGVTLQAIEVASGVDQPVGASGAMGSMTLIAGTSVVLGWNDVDPSGVRTPQACRAVLTSGALRAQNTVISPVLTGGRVAIRAKAIGLILTRVIGYGRCSP